MYAELCYKIDMDNKVCSKCKKLKKHSEFKKDNRVKSGLQAACYDCAYSLRKKNYEVYRKTEKTRELKKYGLSYEEYQEMLKKQDYKCAIESCSRKDGDFKRVLHVDHCHKTGKVRQLLCSHCNTVLGKVNEDLILLQDLTLYLIRHRSAG